jgi:hypothetical protein
MVNAILEGRKTQTRRAVKQPVVENSNWIGGFFIEFNQDNCCSISHAHRSSNAPYQVGNVLWVREMFGQPSQQEMNPGHGAVYYCFKADNSIYHTYTKTGQMVKLPHEYTLTKYKPSIHMPKEACRIFLEVTEVRVQRLQDIPEDDALAEGMIKFDGCSYHHKPNANADDHYISPYGAFMDLWEIINGAKSWKANPFVWAITFKRIDKPANWPNP